MARKQKKSTLPKDNQNSYQSIPQWEPYQSKPAEKQSNLTKYVLGLLLLIMAASGITYLMLNMEPTVIKVPPLIKVASLPKPHVPSPKKDNRLILIGDVHGSYDQLRHLLKKAGYKHKKDHVVLLGDFLSKGNQNIETIDFAMNIGASCVRGNHEQELLEMYSAHHKLPKPNYAMGIAKTIPDDEYASDLDIVRQLTPDHIRYMASCPLILDLHNITANGTNRAVAVHAGMMWNVPNIEDQDQDACLYMRTLLPPKYTEFSEEADGEPWSDVWNLKQAKHPESAMTVYYGHDARSRLQIKPYSFGLDTACVKGKKLSAAIVTGKPDGTFETEIVQVSCKKLKKKKVQSLGEDFEEEN